MTKRTPPRAAAAPSGRAARSSTLLWAPLAGVLVLVAGLAAWFVQREPSTAPAVPAPPPPIASFVGSGECKACHANQYGAWASSQHAQAMQHADAQTVRGDFNDAKFSLHGVTSTFFRRDGKYFVRTDGPDGRLADFEIRYTFGVTPLQQYLVEFPDGRLQALGIAWDARPASEGGGRWFHLYPDRKLEAGDPLHWTGIDQTWNYQCADCHSTNLRKNYDETTNTYATRWTDINVGCEACHGPGSNHVAWAKKERGWERVPGKGLTVLLDERRGVSWAIDAAGGSATRSQPHTSVREIETCARCHARRGQFTDRWHAGDRFADGFRAALIEPGLFWNDGQQRDEVYVYGSFLASRMHAKGVTCSDCHDPHAQKLRAPGNAVCAQCHAPGRFDATSHHHHRPGSKGAECAACHMPTTTYMVVDPRHDHGFRIPRPDRTVSLGIPNACNGCHKDRKPEWAAAAVRAWFPQPKPGFQSFAEGFVAAERGEAGARAALMAVAGDRALSGFVRAGAITRLAPWLDAQTLPTLRAALADGDPQVRSAAVGVLAGVDPGARARLLAPLLGDPLREVRMSAARALAGEPEQHLSAADRAKFAAALDEYVAAERFNADRPEGRTNLGTLYATRGRFDEAVAALRSALALDPTFAPAALNLADVYRSGGQEAEAERTLREALQRDPRAAALHHALGLSLVRQKRTTEALAELAQASRLAPENARFAYVYAVALNDAGRRGEARRELEAALKRLPNDRDLLLAAALFERDAGNRAAALRRAQRLAELEPDSAQVRQLVRDLGGG